MSISIQQQVVRINLSIVIGSLVVLYCLDDSYLVQSLDTLVPFVSFSGLRGYNFSV